MKKLLFNIALLLPVVVASGQNLSQVTISNTGSDIIYTFVVDGNVQINVSKDGKIIEWGTALEYWRMGYYPGKLQPYIGRVEYYGPADNVAFSGKPKYIGSAAITYFSAYENENFAGKVKQLVQQLWIIIPILKMRPIKEI